MTEQLIAMCCSVTAALIFSRPLVCTWLMRDAVVKVILFAAVLCCMKPNVTAMSRARLLSVRRSKLKFSRRAHDHGSDASFTKCIESIFIADWRRWRAIHAADLQLKP